MSENKFSWDSKMPAKVEEREFKIPPIGEYNFIVLEADKTYSSKGNPMIKVRLDLQGADGSVFDNLVLTDNAMFKVVTFFESVGVKKKGEELNISIGDAVTKSIGMEGRCKIKHELYNGETRAKVDKYLIADGKIAPTTPKISEDDLPFEI